jgi:hypothetical protein
MLLSAAHAPISSNPVSGQLTGADLPIETNSFLQRVAFTLATLARSYMDELWS